MEAVFETLSGQNTEAETEAAKFGEDVKYLAGRRSFIKRTLLYQRV